jgi:hypothetical protein
MTELTGKIQSGSMSMDTYFQELSKKINEEKQVATILAKSGYKDPAQICLERIKIMERELSGEI